MARTQAADYEQRRAEIVGQAARLYAKRSFLGASMSDIADACRLSKSALYHYYASKEDILYDVMHAHVHALEVAALDATAMGGDADARLRRLAHSFMQIYVGAAAHQKVLLNELDQLPPARSAEIVAVQRRLIEIVRELLAALKPALANDKGASVAAAMLFFGMINWTHTWFDTRGSVTAAAFADMAVTTFLKGLNG
ncbi:MAG: TetR/AcrR family transcriptional regulator [Hyphomonadaceae bacterium]